MSEREQTSNPAVWAGFVADDGFVLGWKVVRPDGRTHGDFQWPLTPRKWVRAVAVVKANKGPCPEVEGDGLCIAKSWAGAASGGIAAITGLALQFRLVDVLGEDAGKVRVSRCIVLGVMDLQRLICEGHAEGANLRGAYLRGAYLGGAYLGGAYLGGAYLRGAYLGGACLDGAYLDGADLRGAYLRGAYLRGAYLRGAYLRGAYLDGADLRGAYLGGAYLDGADLRGANLRGALGVPESMK